MEADVGGELLGGLLDDNQQRLLQVIMSRGCMPIRELQDVMAQVRGAQVTQEDMMETLHEINRAIEVFGFSIRGVEHGGEDHIGFVNQMDDEIARTYGSTLSPSELEAVRLILKYLSASGTADLSELHSAFTGEGAAVKMSQVELSRFLGKLRDQQYLASADAVAPAADDDDEAEVNGGYGWTIGPRAHLELSTFLADCYEVAGRPAGALPQVLYY